MKIAILTLPLHTNYGGIIQNYALQTVLEKMGHEVYTINLNKPKAKMKLIKAPFSIIKRGVKKYISNKDSIIFIERKINKDKPIIEQNVRRFINNNIHLTKPFYTKKELKEINNLEFDAIIVGSDQVWRVPFAYPDIETYFLDFITNKNIKKLAFSASFGIDDVEFSDTQSKECGELIKQFDFVSVRENTALDIIKTKYKWKCKSEPIHTLDPTMLLSKQDYINISLDYVNKFDGELFYYILDMTEDKKNVLEKLSNDLGYKPFTVKSKSIDFLDSPFKKIVPPLELWLQAFNHAKYIFTDSFHGTVFSLIFNKEFILYANPRRGMSRFNSLINIFPEIKNKLIYKSDDYSKKTSMYKIDWGIINAQIEEKKENSLKILNKSLINKSI